MCSGAVLSSFARVWMRLRTDSNVSATNSMEVTADAMQGATDAAPSAIGPTTGTRLR